MPRRQHDTNSRASARTRLRRERRLSGALEAEALLAASDAAVEASGSSSDGAGEPCGDGGVQRRVRITKVEVLINTNMSEGGSGAIIEALATYLRDVLWTERELESVIVLEPDNPRLLLAVEVQAPAIEVGARQRRVHAHFILRIRHAARVHLGRLQGSLQRHVKRHSIFLGAFVSVRLLNAAAENYALKETFLCDEH